MSGGFIGSNGRKDATVAAVSKLASNQREAASGTTTVALGTRITKLRDDVKEWLKGYYNKNDVDSKIEPVERLAKAAAPANHTHTEDQVTGVWSKSVATAGTGQFDGGMTSLGVFDNALTGTTRPVYVQDDGELGYLPSAEETKMNVTPLTVDPEVLLSLRPRIYQYATQVAMHEADPSHPARWEVGLIAEELHAAGLGAWVMYDGEGVPRGVRYDLWSVAVQQVIRQLHDSANSSRANTAAAIAALQAVDTATTQALAARKSQADGLEVRVTALESRVAALEALAALRKPRQFTSTLAAFTLVQTSRDVAVTWDTPYADSNYTVLKPTVVMAGLALGKVDPVVKPGTLTPTGCTVTVMTAGLAISAGMVLNVTALHN